ncbi:MAG: DUF4139 domain-containing protein [Sphingobacteriales bacterium]|nr:MAG: DUF4139 domain-containing protein [Sphingobacteriales bacterium]
MGQGFIDMRNVRDTMTISLGRDKKVIVRRELDKKRRSVKTLGSNVREAVGFTISVRNTRKEKVNLTLVDQFPLSADKDIEIEEKEAPGATINEQTGIAEWTLVMEPHALKELSLFYSVKFPKGSSINTYK